MKKAKSFPCEVSIIKGTKKVNAKSIVGVLSLQMGYGDKVTFATIGDKKEAALDEIGKLLESVLE
jgi:phosphocarrier protein HPr